MDFDSRGNALWTNDDSTHWTNDDWDVERAPSIDDAPRLGWRIPSVFRMSGSASLTFLKQPRSGQNGIRAVRPRNGAVVERSATAGPSPSALETGGRIAIVASPASETRHSSTVTQK
ncbi:hypothetical protein [Haloterrigena salifodinae]|uniref:hypothetical protein n=1 Tax=Haloterrigena salifodinae TaxID=2675099 RepID=UPI000F875D73|nr:hypothetical protein [Haloterrigena salifodinae]